MKTFYASVVFGICTWIIGFYIFHYASLEQVTPVVSLQLSKAAQLLQGASIGVLIDAFIRPRDAPNMVAIAIYSLTYSGITTLW